jgi:hypothetical protein
LIFGFTYWDYEVIQSIGQTIKDQSQPLENPLYFNLQSRDQESVSEALYSIGEELPATRFLETTGRSTNCMGMVSLTLFMSTTARA